MVERVDSLAVRVHRIVGGRKVANVLLSLVDQLTALIVVLAVLFQLIVNLAHVAQVLPNALYPAKQGPAAVNIRLSRSPARRHRQWLLLLIILRLVIIMTVLLSRPFVPHFDLIEAH